MLFPKPAELSSDYCGIGMSYGSFVVMETGGRDKHRQAVFISDLTVVLSVWNRSTYWVGLVFLFLTADQSVVVVVPCEMRDVI